MADPKDEKGNIVPDVDGSEVGDPDYDVGQSGEPHEFQQDGS